MGQTLLEQLDPRIRQAILGQSPEVKVAPKEPIQYWVKHSDIDEKSFDDIVDIFGTVIGIVIADNKKPQFVSFAQMSAPDCGYREWRINKHTLEARRRKSASGQYWIRFSLTQSNFNPDHVTETDQQRDFGEQTNKYFLFVNKAATFNQTC